MDKSGRKARAILEVVVLVQNGLAEQTKEAFAADARAQELLAFRLLRIGEHARDIAPAARARHPEIDWRSIVDLRNLIAHDYENVDPHRLRRTAEAELDRLAVACRAIVAQSESQP